MNTTAWQKLTKNIFPDDIMKEENITCQYADSRLNTHTIYYTSKKVYVIAIDINHEPAYCSCYKTMIDDTHYICMFQAEDRVTINDETGKVTEEKYFTFQDNEDYTNISVDDENLEYCQYKVIETEDILD